MPLPAVFLALWAIWPLAAYPGGKLFAPLVVLISLFALPRIRQVKSPIPILIGAALLVWVSVSAIWSPAEETLFSGQFLGDDFALEASYLRFAFTMIGCWLFVRLVLHAPDHKLDNVHAWIYAGILAHLVIVSGVAFFREELLAAGGKGLALSGQSMGRNINLLALAAPLLLAGLVGLKDKKIAVTFGTLLTLIVIVLALRLDGLAAIYAIMLGAISYVVVQHVRRHDGFRMLFNMFAAAIFLAPVISFLLNLAAPFLHGQLPLTTQQRVLIWQATLERIVEKPLFGHGVNAAPTWTETYASRPEFLEQLAPQLADSRIIPNHPHNMAMQLWAETGLVGVALICALIVLIGRILPAPKALAIGPRIAAAGVFGAAVAYFSVSYSVWDESFWASVAIAASGVIILHKKSMA